MKYLKIYISWGGCPPPSLRGAGGSNNKSTPYTCRRYVKLGRNGCTHPAASRRDAP